MIRRAIAPDAQRSARLEEPRPSPQRSRAPWRSPLLAVGPAFGLWSGFVAGGGGITPTRALFPATPLAPGDDLLLLCVARNPADVLFRTWRSTTSSSAAPPPMDAVAASTRQAGLPQQHLHAERLDL